MQMPEKGTAPNFGPGHMYINTQTTYAYTRMSFLTEEATVDIEYINLPGKWVVLKKSLSV